MQLSSRAVLLAAAPLCGCASTPPPSQSGFLGDYSQLTPAPDREGVMLGVDPGADLRSRTRLAFDPVQVLATPGPDQAPLPPDVLQRIGAQFEALLRVVAATVTRKGDQHLPQGDRITWDALPPIADYWARNFRTRLDQLRGVSPAPVAAVGQQ